MCSLHVHTWSSGQPTVQRPGSSRGLSVGAGIRNHNLGLPRVSSPTLYPLGQRLPGINTRFLISTRNERSVLIQDIPYYMHTSYETILLQRF